MFSKEKMRSDKGITLLEVIIYMIATVVVIGLMNSVRFFFFEKLNVVQATAKYAQEFDNFNAYFINDVKKNDNVTIEQNGDDIKFILHPTGTVYNYKKRSGEIGDIYYKSIRIATNVKNLEYEKKIIYVNNVKKVLLRLNVVIGGKAQNSEAFKKAIQYTFKYW